MTSGGTRTRGWTWGPFTTRLPVLHTRLQKSELLQGFSIAAATGLALVPLLTQEFGLSFSTALAFVSIQTILIASSPIVFGEPLAPGWITPMLPLTLSFVLGGYSGVTERFQAMAAISLDLALILAVFGITGLANRFIRWLPGSLRAGILLGAAISAFKRVLVDDSGDYLLRQPIATTLASLICLSTTFGALRLSASKNSWMHRISELGLLPGFVAAAIVGPLVHEVHYQMEWGVLIPDFASLFGKASPFLIGWPSWEVFLHCFPLALLGYIVVFTDLVTGGEILREAAASRSDEAVELNESRSHLSLSLRNTVMALTAPFFSTQGILWTGVHVVIVRRWAQGPRSMRSLFDGLSSYYMLGIPVVYFVLPLVTALKPLMGIALTLTLVLTGFACGSLAMAIPSTSRERGVALLTGCSLAFLGPGIGLGIGGVAAWVLLQPTPRHKAPPESLSENQPGQPD